MYAQIYGPEQAANMEAYWKATNPDVAYNTGKMTAEEYKAMTGKYPPGYKKKSSGYGGPEGPPETTKAEHPLSQIEMERLQNVARGYADDNDSKSYNDMLNSYVDSGKITPEDAQKMANKDWAK
jgi:hypothetical protein